MALLNRFSRLVRADFHAVLDHLEEPDLLLRQAIREMEDVLEENRSEQKQLAATCDRYRYRQSELEQIIASVDKELDVCFDADHPDLAKGQIRRKLEAEKLRQQLSRKQRELALRHEDLNQQIAEKAERLGSLKQKAQLLQYELAEAAPNEGEASAVTDDEVELAFLKEQRRRAGSEHSV